MNVRFSSIRGFEPTAELAMFDLFDVDLVHGWLVDPQVSKAKKRLSLVLDNSTGKGLTGLFIFRTR